MTVAADPSAAHRSLRSDITSATATAEVLRANGHRLIADAIANVVARAEDYFDLSQRDSVGARYGVSPPGAGIPGTKAWFTDPEQARAWAETWPGSWDVYDLVEGDLLT